MKSNAEECFFGTYLTVLIVYSRDLLPLIYLCNQENHDALIKCLVEDKRFDKSRPVAACIVYRALLQWRSFEAEKTNIFDRIIHTIRSSIEVTLSSSQPSHKYQKCHNTLKLKPVPLVTNFSP